MSKFIFITGGVVSSLGKGIAMASIGRLLKSHGFKINMIKCDPYLNVDAGTMSPFQHGEVFVTEDGAETDLDLGHYERFVEIKTTKDNNITAGKVYSAVIEKERRGDYLGQTVQIIPHLTDEIKDRFIKLSQGYDIVLIEIGGTVGDIESLPFLEAARQMKTNRNSSDVIYIHLTLVPYLTSTDELKTKPTQHSTTRLREIGIEPDIIITRSDRPLNDELKKKIALFSSLTPEAVIEAYNIPSIYELPELLKKQGIDEQILMLLRLRSNKFDMTQWDNFVSKIRERSKYKKLQIVMAGKYVDLKDSYKSLNEALLSASIWSDINLEIIYLDTEEEKEKIESVVKSANGVIIPGGFGERGIEGKIYAIKIARENKIPFLGICLGMQCASIEFARNVLGLKDANSTEFNPKTKNPVITLIEKQKAIARKGATMRLGNYECYIKNNTLAYKIYKKNAIVERHRHRFEFNNEYIKMFEKNQMIISGVNKKEKLVEIIEYKPHPFFIGVQFHPEFNSRPLSPHPLFLEFIKACSLRSENGI